jgi:chromosome partitioning protein
MRTIAVVNQKGGCGKTTTAINLSAFLALKGRRTLVVDMDPQGHATLGLVREVAEPSKTLYDVFVHHRNGRDTRVHDVIRSVQPNLDVAPADILLSGVPEKLSRLRKRENILAEIIDEVRANYDYVIVDCPPHVGLLTFNALCACAEAIVPVDPSFFSLHGIGKLLETFDVLTQKTGHQIGVRALATLYNGRTRFARDVVDEIRKHLAGRHFTTVIRHSVKLAEAASHGLPIAVYSHRCAGFDDYQALAAEVLEMEKVSASEPAAANAPEGLEKFVLYGPSAPRRTVAGVVFAFEAPQAHRVQLVGDFNEWTLDGTEMTQAGDVWTRVLPLQPGRYRYRYVVDGCWCSDPLNGDVEPSPYGGDNSVCVVAE